MKKMSFKPVKLNTDQIVDSTLAYLSVIFIPQILNQYVFKDSPVTGYAVDLLGVGGAYLAGSLFNKPQLANVGIGIAVGRMAGGLLKITLHLAGPVIIITCLLL